MQIIVCAAGVVGVALLVYYIAVLMRGDDRC